jgi:hypothetical protein
MSSETNQTILDNSNTSVNTEHLQLSKILDDDKMTQILNDSLSFLEKNLSISNKLNEPNIENDDSNEEISSTVESDNDSTDESELDTSSKNNNCENSYTSIVDGSTRNFVNENLLRVNGKTDSFIYNFTNCILLTLLLTEFYYILVNFERSSFSVFIFNLLMVLFYNSNSDVLVETQVQYFHKLKKYWSTSVSFLKSKCNNLFEYFLDYLFSKQTQMMLKFICNIGITKLKNKYMFYKNSLFNPVLLHETNKERIYCVPFYLNGKTYKIPIVENKSSLDSKQPPLMILDNNENEVTQNVIDFMGPNNDFYGMILKPKHLNYKSLVFMMEDGSEMNLLENDMIVL